jgi:hypothetical protein
MNLSFFGFKAQWGEIIHEHRYKKAPKTKGESELVRERAAAVRANRLRSEMLLAKSRGELIEKELVEKQAAYLLIAMRQKILNLPVNYARRLVGLHDVREVMKVLQGAAHSIFNEIKNLPSKAIDPLFPPVGRAKRNNLPLLASPPAQPTATSSSPPEKPNSPPRSKTP